MSVNERSYVISLKMKSQRVDGLNDENQKKTFAELLKFLNCLLRVNFPISVSVFFF
jgi:hypothetical protein